MEAVKRLSPELIQGLLQELTENHREQRGLRSVISTVIIGDRKPAVAVDGWSMTGVPVVAEMHLRNGAVAITYLAVVLLRAVEEGRVNLDDTVGRWLPDENVADEITLRMLIGMTAGYPDYVGGSTFLTRIVSDPFRSWSFRDQLDESDRMPRRIRPGERFGYSHTNLVVLARSLEIACDEDMESLMNRYVIEPLGLSDTACQQTAWMPEPVLHSFTAARGPYEDSTFWNPSWTLGRGSVQYSTLPDMAKSMHAIVRGTGVLQEHAYSELIDQGLGSVNNRDQGDPHYGYGLGLMQIGAWLGQTPLFGGYASSVLTLPQHVAPDEIPITIGVTATMGETSPDGWSGPLPNRADELVRQIGERLVPDQAPPPFPDDWRSWRDRMNALHD